MVNLDVRVLRIVAAVVYTATVLVAALTLTERVGRQTFTGWAHTPVLGPLVAVLVVAVLVGALIPRSVVALTAGLVFGAVTGTLYVLLGLLLAAAAGHGLGRWLGHDQLAGTRFWATVDRAVANRGAFGVALVRLLPAPPFGLASLLMGAGTVRLRDQCVGSVVGAFPNAVGYAAAGGALVSTGWSAAFSAATGVAGIVAGVVVAVVERRRLSSVDSRSTR